MKTKSLLIALLLLGVSAAQTWTVAQPGYRYEFPRDHFNHPDYQTEWWYYTGNLRAQNGHRFGFELTFFRTALRLPPDAKALPVVWRPDQIYLAHLALSDLDGHEFYHQERMNRSGPGLAGVDLDTGRYWNGNWRVQCHDNDQELEAVTDSLRLSLNLHTSKPVVVNGENGISQKGPQPGEASHYLSFPLLAANGHIRWRQNDYAVSGVAWMDHEFFSEPADNSLAGWDWFSIQLDNNQELMLYRVRRKGEAVDRFSSGTYIDSAGRGHFLPASEFTLKPQTQGRGYPISWQIAIPSLDLSLQEHTSLQNQEIVSRTGTTPSYWEGAVTYTGQMKGKPLTGVGYLEMTGYGQPVWLAAK